MVSLSSFMHLNQWQIVRSLLNSTIVSFLFHLLLRLHVLPPKRISSFKRKKEWKNWKKKIKNHQIRKRFKRFQATTRHILYFNGIWNDRFTHGLRSLKIPILCLVAHENCGRQLLRLLQKVSSLSFELKSFEVIRQILSHGAIVFGALSILLPN